MQSSLIKETFYQDNIKKGNPRITLIIMATILIIISLSYLFMNLGPRPDIIFPLRLSRILAIILIAVAVGYSSVVFQTLTNTRILSPGVLGFENIYMFIQTGIVFFLSSGHYFITGVPNFLLSVFIMIIFSLVIFFPLFKGNGKSNNLYFLLLLGIVLGTMFSSMTTYMQLMINPDEFMFIQSRMFATFHAPNVNLIVISAIMITLTLLAIPAPRQLDAMSLGREIAIGLGVNYKIISIRILIIVSILVSISTALVGPVMFLGILVANISYHFMKTYKHIYIIPASILISGIALIGGQYLVSRGLNFPINLSILINFIGGIYFIFLLLKQRGQKV
ncbi:MAG: iron chelate uptake ABC transporter family permease subunit [Erysipelotrichales bacterium]|nr:iron chelate uptake ABC transporter family permease subunit [Erysipelotrichales bacterium]